MYNEIKGVIGLSLNLRGHHLLCVHGFRGMGYSPEFVRKMSAIVEQIRDEQQDFPIKVVAALDDTCCTCPHKGKTTCEASAGSNEHVLTMDLNVIRQLELIEGAVYHKSYLVQLTAEKVKPEDLDYLCKGCSWLSYGVCKEGIADLREKYVK
ncbi:DUF1284 domain-containing protein [Bacillus sp. ISL-18]|uniref:DUF1284 domain-containing protein n=1 Tax=Bacillus sp. ISL-18 TaxID=2819118 RepID=UPI001BE932EF|nr:DUF1284 domain-containing protein [Bacillus sp. ISL-18]MBT2655056.1 DUF1284 domain-containing protein [Bacillus sp. ISL-18]